MTRRNRNASAFTLLEMVVVMGIVAVAMGVFVLTVLKVRARVGDVTCQNNLRQLLSALEMYNLEYNGSMPYGFFYVGSAPPAWEPPPGGNNQYISWASELNKYFDPAKGYAMAFRCPQAQQQAGPHIVSYVMNFIVAVSPYYEMQVGTPPSAQSKPPSLHLMFPAGTALIWDTPIRPDFTDEGYLVGADIDAQRFWQGAGTPQARYYSPHDPLGSISPSHGNNAPVRFSASSSVYQNIDPPANSSYPYQGNLRFRHNNQTRCNVAFSDGSVRQFTAVVNANNTVASHDALRRYFMINWPPGVPPNPAYPFLQDPPPMILRPKS